MYEKSAKTTSILSVPKNKVKLDQKLIEISYKKGGPPQIWNTFASSRVFPFSNADKSEIEYEN